MPTSTFVRWVANAIPNFGWHVMPFPICHPPEIPRTHSRTPTRSTVLYNLPLPPIPITSMCPPARPCMRSAALQLIELAGAGTMAPAGVALTPWAMVHGEQRQARILASTTAQARYAAASSGASVEHRVQRISSRVAQVSPWGPPGTEARFATLLATPSSIAFMSTQLREVSWNACEARWRRR